jgi:predicted nucleic acid-binding protein
MSKIPYFIDTNIFLYSIGRDHPLKSPCVHVIQKIREGKTIAIVSTEIVQEILYRFQSIRQLPTGMDLANDVISISSRILPVIERDLILALEILKSHSNMPIRDAFHAATMINNGVKEILSTDPHFDLIREIKRVDPSSMK